MLKQAYSFHPHRTTAWDTVIYKIITSNKANTTSLEALTNNLLAMDPNKNNFKIKNSEKYICKFGLPNSFWVFCYLP
jgi:hypothetical protein